MTRNPTPFRPFLRGYAAAFGRLAASLSTARPTHARRAARASVRG